jgi:hypothetical protein
MNSFHFEVCFQRCVANSKGAFQLRNVTAIVSLLQCGSLVSSESRQQRGSLFHSLPEVEPRPVCLNLTPALKMKMTVSSHRLTTIADSTAAQANPPRKFTVPDDRAVHTAINHKYRRF